jgi:protein associated with RNAse G/E
MNNLKIGSKFQIHSYKHDGTVYRSWDEAIVLDITNDYIVVGNNQTLVTEVDGRMWKTKEPAIIYFYKNKWYNVICQLKSSGTYYYCNIATPYIIEENTIKYIDYDIDLRIFPDESYKILDRAEYQYHKKKMEYSNDIDMIVKKELSNLILLYKRKEDLFNYFTVQYYYSLYKEYKMKANIV